MNELNAVKDKLAKLVGQYNEKANILGQNEARTRQYLIDPFWEALGWDMRNPDHVDVESNVHSDELDLSDKEHAGTKRADYTFLYSYNKTAFVVEAKKPKVSLHDEKVINQLKRYGFTLGIDIGILHDFEEFRAFDTAFPVTPRPEVNLIKEFDIGYEQYPDLADKLLETFGREAVLGGSIQRLVGRVRKGKSTIPVDRQFLNMLKGWRERLAIGLANQNPAYSIHDINEYVGRILNRIIFLRVIEERHALTGKPLKGAWNDYRSSHDIGAKIKLYEQLKPFFIEMNEIFNGVLFKPTDWDEMKVPDPPVYDMLKEIYNPLVPYDFGVIPVELLGTIYERFLGEVVVRKGKKVTIEQKPEVRKAGGVYYTPKYIVDYIVEQTVGKLIKGKSPEQIRKLKILDPACGSGSFLIGAYEKLMKYHLEWFKKHPKRIRSGIGRADAYVDGDNNWRLGFHVKREILVNNIFGVDIDGRAVEVTMLSLYLKLMEDETYLTLEGMKYLPDLKNNIKCGNSLIGWDIADMDILPTDPDERQAELERINPFDWEGKNGFPEIMKAGGFDAVIGNPPYVGINSLSENEIVYLREEYKYPIDTYTTFIEKGIILVKTSGLFSFIIPRFIWVNANTEELRCFLFENGLKKVIEAGMPFADAAIECALFLFSKGEISKEIEIEEIHPFERVFISRQKVNAIKRMPNRILNTRLPNNSIKTLHDIIDKSNRVGEHFKSKRGLEIAKKKARTLKGKEILYIGEEISRYFANPPEAKVDINASFIPESIRAISKTNKFFLRRVSNRLQGTICSEKAVFTKNLYGIVPLDKYSLSFLCGYLNSNFATWLFKSLFTTKKEDLFPEIQTYQFENMPLPSIDFSNPDDVAKHDRMVSLVTDMLALNKRLHETESPSTKKSIEAQIAHTDRAIDELVYELYDLTPEEIAIVEGK